ncbi:hypothetical protein [Saccharopolyspora spinosa]|uniref:Uncharacterized protein n=1 Tax=Saccharopolyspora spinosa TaxID=60894 RepID=A0A2N3XZB4_SACSN|nr:hypothetical protein [Saccharopolyspora spinosa]PKW16015.1 hypothetical protein A8926_3803 [Saccharopolyspora spinosa]
MPSYFEVFFGGSDQESIVGTIEQIIRLRLDPTEEEYADFIGVRDSGTEHFVSFELLLKHRLDYEADEDTGIPFEQMPSSLTVRGPRGDEEQHEALAHGIFTQLKESGYKPIYFVWDLDQVIELWDPDQKGDSEVMEFWEPGQKGDHGKAED